MAKFGSIKQTAEYFSLPASVVREKAQSGEWPSYVIGGHRVFNIDEIVQMLIESAGQSKHSEHEVAAR